MMATLPHNADTNRLFSSYMPSLDGSSDISDAQKYQQNPLNSAGIFATEFEAQLHSASLQQGHQAQVQCAALATHPEELSRLSSSSSFDVSALDSSSTPRFSRYEDTQYCQDLAFGAWNGRLSHNRMNGAPVSPFTQGFFPENISLLEVIANNAGTLTPDEDSSILDGFAQSPLTEKHLSHAWGMNGYNAGLTLEQLKGGLPVQDVNDYACQTPLNTFPAAAVLGDRMTRFSSVNKQTHLLHSAANHGANHQPQGESRDKAFTPNISAPHSGSLRVSTTLCPLSSITANINNSLDDFQHNTMNEGQVFNLAANIRNECHADTDSKLSSMESSKMVSSKKPPPLLIPVDVDGSDGMGKPSNSMEESDGSMGLEVSSGCDRDNRWETASHLQDSGKKKRLKESKNSVNNISDAKDFEGENVQEKRRKNGDDTNEGEPDKRIENDDSDDSTRPSIKDTSIKLPETPKPDYIHVRARRGQATDSHSLAERIRREKISERMKFLQDLVPGCSKITGKAVMLDEIINYVQSLQRQIEFLSMKLAAVNPRIDFNVERLFRRDIFQQQPSMLPVDSSHYAPVQNQSSQVPIRLGGQGVIPRSLGGKSDAVTMLREATNTPLASKEGFGYIVSQQASRAWDDELQNLVQMTSTIPTGRQPSGGSSKPES
ncbi:hypothetical protein KP509_1Z049600 [Ceratopteris richardii]|nr:hypothetical protein KP509_1Z049600 [Ceratopteris richardii]